MSRDQYIVETLSFNKTGDPEYPYTVTIANDIGLQTTIWFDSGTMGEFLYYFNQMQDEKHEKYGFTVISRRKARK